MPTGDTSIPEGFYPAPFDIPFLRNAGPYHIKEHEGRYLIGTRISEGHINSTHIAHGGVLTTLADVALSYQVYRSKEPYVPIATITLNTNFLSGAQAGEWIEADCEIDRIGKSIAYVHGLIRSGDRTILTMNGVFKILG